MAEEDDDIKRLFGISSQTFDDHTKRISALLEKAQEKFEHDYTSYAAVGGSAMIVFSGLLAWFGKSESFAIVVAVIGALLFLIGLILRHLSADKQVGHTKALLELERERSRFVQKSAVFQHLWLYGQPKNLTIEQVRFFLDEGSMSATQPSPSVPPARQIAEKVSDDERAA